MELDGFGRIQYAVRIEARKSPALDSRHADVEKERRKVISVMDPNSWNLDPGLFCQF